MNDPTQPNHRPPNQDTGAERAVEAARRGLDKLDHRPAPELVEGAIAQAWQEQLAHRPALATTLLRQSRALYDRFVAAYRELLALSRQRRRKLLRNLGTSLAGAALALALSHAPAAYAYPPTIANAHINGTDCDLIDAITAANTDTATGLSAAGTPGADTITLLSDVTLTAVNNTPNYGGRGLPGITSAITIEGAGFTIARDAGAPAFGILFVDNTGDLTLNATTITGGNGVVFGGGIISIGGNLTLSNSTVNGNSAGGGGGIFNFGFNSMLTNSTISGNTATYGGGGIQNNRVLTLNNSTISGNTASFGGGIYNDTALTLVRSLISGNSAANGSEIYNYFIASINGNNFNLIGHDGNALTSGFSPSGSDIVPSQALAAILGPLAANGGGTFTHALVTGSPAIDVAPTGPATDQRGVSRPQGANFDIGAFELEQAANQAPVVGPITAPVAPVQVGTAINASASFTDPDTGDTHTATWDWGDGATPGTVTESNGAGSVADSHTYTTPGVYTVKLTVDDGNGGVGESIYQYVVVYDPAGGFVTGGGWITSPAGAYVADPALTGKANFGFNSKYKKGQSTPSGDTQFQFQTANLNFKSTSYEWLVVAGSHAKYKGVGTINGSGNYGFMLTATDGQVNGGGGVDKFRIKIWDKDNGDAVVYDNQMSEGDDSNAGTALGGGSIVIHKGVGAASVDDTNAQANRVFLPLVTK